MSVSGPLSNNLVFGCNLAGKKQEGFFVVTLVMHNAPWQDILKKKLLREKSKWRPHSVSNKERHDHIRDLAEKYFVLTRTHTNIRTHLWQREILSQLDALHHTTIFAGKKKSKVKRGGKE